MYEGVKAYEIKEIHLEIFESVQRSNDASTGYEYPSALQQGRDVVVIQDTEKCSCTKRELLFFAGGR